jgi:hypothetical protein
MGQSRGKGSLRGLSEGGVPGLGRTGDCGLLEKELLAHSLPNNLNYILVYYPGVLPSHSREAGGTNTFWGDGA